MCSHLLFRCWTSFPLIFRLDMCQRIQAADSKLYKGKPVSSRGFVHFPVRLQDLWWCYCTICWLARARMDCRVDGLWIWRPNLFHRPEVFNVFIYAYKLIKRRDLGNFSITRNNYKSNMKFIKSCYRRLYGSDPPKKDHQLSQIGIVVISRAFHLFHPGSIPTLHTWAEICRSQPDSEGFFPVLRFSTLGGKKP